MDEQILRKLGMTTGEIRTYLAMLELGSSTTGPIANAAQISRSKVYVVLDRLEKKGLASHVEQNGMKYFQVADPIRIKSYIREREEELKEIGKEFDSSVENLRTLYKETGRVKSVSVYQGLKGLQTAHEHTYLKVKKGETYDYLGGPRFQPESHHRYWKKDHLKRVAAGIKCRLLFNKGTPRETLRNRNSFWGCDARYMPIDIYSPAYFLVYKDTVMMTVSEENPIVIEIVSKEIAEAFSTYFEEFWKRSVPFK